MEPVECRTFVSGNGSSLSTFI